MSGQKARSDIRCAVNEGLQWAGIDGRAYWINAMLRVRESQLRAQNGGCCTRKEQSGRRVSRGSAPLLILLFVHEGLKPINRLTRDVHQLS